MCVTTGSFEEKKIFPQKCAKSRIFLNLDSFKVLVIKQIPFFGKIEFLKYRPKCDIGQNAFGQLGNRTFKSNVSLEKNDEIACFFAC